MPPKKTPGKAKNARAETPHNFIKGTFFAPGGKTCQF
jgi:hypothetical protein